MCLRKRLLMLMAALVLFAVLISCSQNERVRPSDTAVIFLDHIKAGEFEEALELLTDTESVFVSLTEISSEYRDIFKNLTYTINAEKVSGNTARVTLTIQTPDFLEATRETMSEAAAHVHEGITEEELFVIVEELLYEKMTGSQVSSRSQTISVEMEKKDGIWFLAADETFVNAVTGGMGEVSEEALK